MDKRLEKVLEASGNLIDRWLEIYDSMVLTVEYDQPLCDVHDMHNLLLPVDADTLFIWAAALTRLP